MQFQLLGVLLINLTLECFHVLRKAFHYIRLTLRYIDVMLREQLLQAIQEVLRQFRAKRRPHCWSVRLYPLFNNHIEIRIQTILHEFLMFRETLLMYLRIVLVDLLTNLSRGTLNRRLKDSGDFLLLLDVESGRLEE